MWFRRQRTEGPTIPPNRLPPSIALDDDGPGSGRSGPGGGRWWGGGPRWFVGWRGGTTRTELGVSGDFVQGGDGTRLDSDPGFPTASRWPGYPDPWVPPYYDTGGPFTGGRGYPGTPTSYPPGGDFMGGSALTGRISTVFACTDLISRLLATMGLRVMENGQPVPVPPPWIDNPEPEIYTSIVEPVQALVNSMLHRGEAFIAPTARYPDDDMVARWVVLNPDHVEVEPGVGGMPLYSIGGRDVPREDILHIRYQTWPGQVHGIGPLEACARNLVSADALQAWGTALSTSNGIPTAVLQSEVKLTKEQAQAIKQSWAESAMSRGVIPAVLTGGLTYTPLNLKPSDVGLLDLRMFDEQRIAACFGTPLWLVGLPVNDGLTYSTVEGTFEYFWRVTLRSIAYNVASAFSGWALPRRQYLRFASEQITEPALADRANIYSTLIAAGVLTPEDVRAMEPLLRVYRNEGV